MMEISVIPVIRSSCAIYQGLSNDGARHTMTANAVTPKNAVISQGGEIISNYRGDANDGDSATHKGWV